jgi:4-aminobutyrate aminotransferase-like enzyme
MIKNHILYNSFSDWTFNTNKAEGSFIWNEKGEKLIDFTSGWNVVNLGWNNPEITDAASRQLFRGSYAPMWTSNECLENFASELSKVLPKELDTYLRTTGGTESNEKALMLARNITKRKKIIGFKDTYHGQSYGTISIGYRPEYVLDEAPTVPEFIQIDFPRRTGDDQKDKVVLEKFSVNLEKILKNEDIAAIVTEAGIITGWGSTFVAPESYLTIVRKLTEKYGTLLILDEVGTGFSRCGKLFGMNIENIVPDLATFAKGLTNGVGAMGGVAVKSSYGEELLSNAKTTSTFGWMPVSVAAATKVLEIHIRDKVYEKASEMGKYMLNEMKGEFSSGTSIQADGLGMEIGLTFIKSDGISVDEKTAKTVASAALKKGLHLVYGGDGNIQIMPPLTTSKNVLSKGLEILFETVKTVIKK